MDSPGIVKRIAAVNPIIVSGLLLMASNGTARYSFGRPEYCSRAFNIFDVLHFTKLMLTGSSPQLWSWPLVLNAAGS